MPEMKIGLVGAGQMAQAQRQMAGMAGGMGMGGGGMGGASELEMLRRENAAMKRALHDEL